MNRKDLSPELQLDFADAEIQAALEYHDHVLSDPDSRPSERLMAFLEVRAARERRDDIVNTYGLWDE